MSMLSWPKAVKAWNGAAAWKDDLYALPKKGGEFYDEVRELMGHKKPATPAPVAAVLPAAPAPAPVIEHVVAPAPAPVNEFEEKKQKAIQEVLEYDAEKEMKSSGVKDSHGYKLNWAPYGKNLTDEKKVYYLKQMITDLEKGDTSYEVKYDEYLKEMKNSKNVAELTEAKKGAKLYKDYPFIDKETIRRRKEVLEKLEKTMGGKSFPIF